MRIVFDTNVLISSTLWDESIAQKLLFKLIVLDAKIFTSIPIISEYKNVLKRDFDYIEEEIESILEKIISFLTVIQVAEEVDIVKKDPDDNKIMECALSSSSEYIVTYDKHLLDIETFKGIKIVKPQGLLRILGEV